MRDHLSHMVKGFEKHTRARVPKRVAVDAQYADFVARVGRRKSRETNASRAAAAAEAEDTMRALVPVSPAKRTRMTSPDPADPPDAGALLAAWSSYPGVSFASTETSADEGRGGRVAVAMHGHVSNALEIRELYGLPPRAASPPLAPETPPTAVPQKRCTRAGARAQAKRAEDVKAMPPPPPVVRPSPDVESASLLLELYLRRFEDADGDPSDQPATALAACEGSFSFVLLDSTRDAVLAARSAHSDTHPLFWGTAPRNPGETGGGVSRDAPSSGVAATELEWDGSTLFASDPAAIDAPCGGAAAAFPLGAFYYVDETMEYGVIQRLNPEGSRAKRRVKPVHRINSSGKVCGLGFYTESGNDLASMAGKYIA